MLITTVVSTSDPAYPWTDETAAAAQVLAALGGNPADDVSTVRVDQATTHITCNVELQSGDSMAYTAEQAADQVLAALAGNPTRDYCIVQMNMSGVSGEAGVRPE